jgi:hypothetical protein
MALVSTGRYRAIYTASDTDDLEQLVWTFSVVEGGATRVYGNTTVIVDYRKKPPVVIWPSYFVDLATHVLAAAFAIPVREDKSLRDEMHRIAYGPPEMEMRGGMFAVAKKLDAKAKPTKSMFANGDPFTAARFGGFPTRDPRRGN